MKSSLQAMAWPALFRRWRSLDNRDLWGLIAALFALYLLLLSLLTQPPDEMLNMFLVLGGALLVLHHPPRRLAAPAGAQWAVGWGGPAGGGAVARPAHDEL